jgi:hypothetical protein
MIIYVARRSPRPRRRASTSRSRPQGRASARSCSPPPGSARRPCTPPRARPSRHCSSCSTSPSKTLRAEPRTAASSSGARASSTARPAAPARRGSPRCCCTTARCSCDTIRHGRARDRVRGPGPREGRERRRGRMRACLGVSGAAFVAGLHQFVLDARDSLIQGFLLSSSILAAMRWIKHHKSVLLAWSTATGAGAGVVNRDRCGCRGATLGARHSPRRARRVQRRSRGRCSCPCRAPTKGAEILRAMGWVDGQAAGRECTH